MRWIIGGKAAKGSGASPSQMGRFETNWLAQPENLARSYRSLRSLDRPVAKRRPRGSRRARYGLERQPNAWRSREQRLERAFRLHLLPSALRLQSVSAIWNDARFALATCIVPTAGKPFSSRSLHATKRILPQHSPFEATPPLRNRACTSTSNPRASNTRSAFPPIRYSRRRSLICSSGRSGRPAHYVQRFYRSFRYQAASWSRPRRVVAKVEWHPGSCSRASDSSLRT